jgi:PAS domain S-box-containing protein
MQQARIEILLIEEKLSEAGLIKEMLSDSREPEFSVRHVQTLSEGLSLLQNRKFDIVLVDLELPDSRGLESALSVRNQSKLTPIIVLTVLDDKESALKSLQADIQDYLVIGEINANGLMRSILYSIQRKRDVESLRESEEALRAARSQLQLVTDTMAVGVTRCSRDLRYLWVNPAYAKWLRRAPEEIVGRPITDVIGHAAYEVISPHVKRVLAGERVEFEARVDYQGPGPVWIHAIYVPTLDPAGVADGWVAVVADITEQKLAERKLLESETKFSKAFQAVPALISISSMQEGRYLDVNEEFLKALEFERDEIVGHTSLELGIWDTPSRDLLIRMLREQGKVRDLETCLRRKSGSLLIGLVSTEIIEIEAEECLLTLTRDITELRQAERERTNLALIVESSEDAIIGKTLEGIITSWNKGAEKIYGFSAQEVKGRHISILAPHDLPDEVPRILEKLKRGESIKRLETTRVRKDGRLISVALTISPIMDENERLVGASTIARDITDRKRAEEEIEKLNGKLASRAAELETANRDLEAFNYTVAHDLRQPLNVVSSYCQAIEVVCGDQVPKECRDYVRGANEATLRMNRLIEALLNFSRLAHVETRREMVDLSALAREVALELQQAEPSRQVDFRIAEGILAVCDAPLLRVVLDNLLGNAWKYTGLQDNTVIEFDVTALDGKPVYYVRDNGPGFYEDEADKLFVPFQRLPGVPEFRGFGIGLATVERIVQRHGGRVWAKGEKGKGATFYFTLSSDEARA